MFNNNHFINIKLLYTNYIYCYLNFINNFINFIIFLNLKNFYYLNLNTILVSVCLNKMNFFK